VSAATTAPILLNTITRNWWTGALKKIKASYDTLIAKASTKYGVPKDVVLAVILHESGGDEKIGRREPSGKKCRGAECVLQPGDKAISYGLMQILDKTAKTMGYKGSPIGLFIPSVNIDLGVRLLGDNYAKFKSWPLAVAAYNAGGGRVQQVIDTLKTNDWQSIILMKNQLTDKKFTGFKNYTIPYLEHVFARGGMREIAATFV